jgi:hypothetical protein
MLVALDSSHRRPQYSINLGRAIAEAVSRRLPTAAARVWQVGWWTKLRRGRVSPSTSVSPASLHSTKFSIITLTRGRYNRPEVADMPSGPSLDSNPHYANPTFIYHMGIHVPCTGRLFYRSKGLCVRVYYEPRGMSSCGHLPKACLFRELELGRILHKYACQLQPNSLLCEHDVWRVRG